MFSRPSRGEVAQLFDFAAVTLSRYEDDAVVVVADPQDSGFPVGSRWPFDGDSLSVRVRATGRMARIDDYTDIEGSAGARMRSRDSRSAVGVPIVVEGSLWGILCVGAAASLLLPADIETRIAGFVELVATAIANSPGAGRRCRVLADEQAALRRVATLVARDAPSTEVFDAVATEVGKLLDTDITVVGRYDGDGAATAIGSWSASPGGVPVGTRSAVGGHNVLTLVARDGQGRHVSTGTTTPRVRLPRSRAATAGARRSRPRSSSRVACGASCSSPRSGRSRSPPAPRSGWPRSRTWSRPRSRTRRRTTRWSVSQPSRRRLRRIATLVAEGLQPEEVFAAVMRGGRPPLRYRADDGRQVRGRPAGVRRRRRSGTGCKDRGRDALGARRSPGGDPRLRLRTSRARRSEAS